MRRKITLLFLLVFFYLQVSSQSLSPIFASKNAKVNDLCDRARNEMITSDDNLTALKTADEAKQIAIADQDLLATAKANATLGWVFLDGNNLDAAKNFVEKAFANIEHKNFPEATAMLHHQIAIIFDKKGQPKEALKNYLKSIKYYQNSKNYQKLTQIYMEISRLYLVTGEKQSFRNYFSLTEDLLQKHPDPQLQLSFNNQKSFLLMSESKFPEAYTLNMNSLQLAKKINKKVFVATSYYNAAGALFEQGKTSEALSLLEEGMNYAESNKMDYSDYLVGKAQILSSLGKNTEAEQLYLNSIKNLRRSGNKFMEMQARNLLAEFYKSANKKELSAEQFIAAKQIQDSIASAKQAVALKEVEYQYKDDEKEKLLQSYKTSAKQKNWIIGLVFVLGLAALYSFINVRKNLKLKQSLFDKKEKLLESEKENALKQKELAINKEEKAVLSEKLLKEEQERLQLEKQNTDRELASITLYVQEKNKMMEELQSKVDNLLSNSSEENRSKILDITRNIKQSISFEKDWDKIKLHFEKVHPEFFTKLSEICPQLTQNELKHCAYIKMNMSNKETANLLGVDHNTVKMSRYRIKKKLELPQEDDLTQFINNI